jgi:hypothetical protein
VPAGWVDQKDSVGGGFNGCGDLREVQVHRFGIAGRQDQGCALALLRAYRTEDVGGGGTLVTRCAWAGAALRPATGYLVLLADTGLVGEPDFYRVSQSSAFARATSSSRTGKLFKIRGIPGNSNSANSSRLLARRSISGRIA